jgi:hypothetical protein
MGTPPWTVGQSWLVKVSYANYRAEGQWSSPILWRYTVVDEGGGASGNCIEIKVSPLDDPSSEVALIKLAKDDGRPLSVTTVKQVRGKRVTLTRPYTDLQPLVTQISMVPFDLPVFPILDGQSDRYPVETPIAGDLIRKREIILHTSVSPLPKESGMAPDMTEFLKVSADYDNGEHIFTQYWEEGKPWPSFGENGSMRYWLVDDEK